MQRRLKMSVFLSAYIPVLSAGLGSSTTSAVPIGLPSVPEPAVALVVWLSGALAPRPVSTRSRLDCCSRIWVTKRGLFGSTERLRNDSQAPLPPRLALSSIVLGLSKTVRLNSFASDRSFVLSSTVTSRFMPQLPTFAALNSAPPVNEKEAAVAAFPPVRTVTRTTSARLPPLAKNCWTAQLIGLCRHRPPKARS